MNKFVEIPSKEKGYEKETDWHQHCRSKQIPFITVKTRTNLADVHWDFITYNTPETDQKLSDLSKLIEMSAFDIFKKYANDASTQRINCHLIYFYGLSIPQARLAADELYDLIVSLVP